MENRGNIKNNLMLSYNNYFVSILYNRTIGVINLDDVVVLEVSHKAHQQVSRYQNPGKMKRLYDIPESKLESSTW